MKERLKDSGLTENEARIYETLLHIGPSAAGAIAKKSGLHRRVVYDSLHRLTEKGFVSHATKNNTRFFQAENPQTILEFLKEKQNKMQEILPHMLALFTQTKEKEDIRFYRGKKGLKTAIEDQITEGKEILILGASPLAYEILQFYFKWFDKRRVENKIKVKIIFNKTQSDQKIPLSEIRSLLQKYSSPLAVNIYGNKVAIILWSKENPLAIVIQNKEISDGYRKYFELMWKIAKK